MALPAIPPIQKPVPATRASWDLRGAKFASPGTLGTSELIPILNISGSTLPRTLQANLLKQLRVHGLLSNSNITVDITNGYVAQPSLTREWERDFRPLLDKAAAKGRGCPIFVVLGEHSQDVYASIKRVGDLSAGIPTVCVRRQTINDAARGSPGDLQKISDIALKLNLKIAGDNHYLAPESLQRLRTPQGSATTIVIGADVSHPNKSSRAGTPSVAAVVGSIDDNFVKFPGSMRLQPSLKEDIVELAEMVKERILAWAQRHQGRLPNNVLFYRDGVSESQYDILTMRELPQIQIGMNLAYLELKQKHQKAASKDDPPGKPDVLAKVDDRDFSRAEKLQKEKQQEHDQAFKVESNPKNRHFNLTFIVAGKRHNAKLYPTQQQDQARPTNENVRPGLLIDQVITQPYRTDFYLQSHYPVQGTGRSAHYIVLRNNMDLTVEELHSITHAFCYIHASATKGVSYCTPAYYADKLCDRGRTNLRHLWINRNPPTSLPDPRSMPTFEAFKLAMKNAVEGHLYYRSNQSSGQNPWHSSMNDIMFYL